MINGVRSVADDLGTRSSDMTLEATTTRRTLVPSIRVSSAAEMLLTSGETQFGILSCGKKQKVFTDM